MTVLRPHHVRRMTVAGEQCRIARIMAQRIVESFEIVDVEHGHAECRMVTLCAQLVERFSRPRRLRHQSVGRAARARSPGSSSACNSLTSCRLLLSGFEDRSDNAARSPGFCLGRITSTAALSSSWVMFSALPILTRAFLS